MQTVMKMNRKVLRMGAKMRALSRFENVLRPPQNHLCSIGKYENFQFESLVLTKKHK